MPNSRPIANLKMQNPLARPEIQIVPTVEELGLAAALQFVHQGKEAILEKNLFTVALTGGSMPKGAYSRLANDPALNKQLPWGSVHFFWTDERYVARDHAENNYQKAHETMLAKLPLPPENVHAIRGDYRSAGQAAHAYERRLRKFFVVTPEQLPRFDLVLLGIGTDGHITSLLPGSKALFEQKRLVVANWVETRNAYWITMTAVVLNNAACVIFLVSGEEKSAMLSRVLYGEFEPQRYPAQVLLRVKGRVLWIVDKAAARLLPG